MFIDLIPPPPPLKSPESSNLLVSLYTYFLRYSEFRRNFVCRWMLLHYQCHTYSFLNYVRVYLCIELFFMAMLSGGWNLIISLYIFLKLTWLNDPYLSSSKAPVFFRGFFPEVEFIVLFAIYNLSRQAIKNRVNRAAKLAVMSEGVGSATFGRVARPNPISYQRKQTFVV